MASYKSQLLKNINNNLHAEISKLNCNLSVLMADAEIQHQQKSVFAELNQTSKILSDISHEVSDVYQIESNQMIYFQRKFLLICKLVSMNRLVRLNRGLKRIIYRSMSSCKTLAKRKSSVILCVLNKLFIIYCLTWLREQKNM